MEIFPAASDETKMNMLFGRCKTFEVNNPEATYKVHYLGNVMTSLLKGANHLNVNSLNGPGHPKATYMSKLILEEQMYKSSSSETTLEQAEDQDEDQEDYNYSQSRQSYKENYYVNGRLELSAYLIYSMSLFQS